MLRRDKAKHRTRVHLTRRGEYYGRKVLGSLTWQISSNRLIETPAEEPGTMEVALYC